MSKKKTKKKLKLKKSVKMILTGILLLISLLLVVVILNSVEKGGIDIPNIFDKSQQIDIKKEEKKLKIIDENSNTRNIAVMVNNHGTARKYHAGLQDAYIVYEIVVEGGITRMMAIYKDANTAKIGSVRSSRHYYLDYVMENDAIYVHYGWSPQAQADISRFRINNINADGSAFWRDKSLGVSTEHTAFTSMEKINNTITKKGYRTTTEKKNLLSYSVDEIDLSQMEGAIPANQVDIKYSSYVTSKYTYDEENKVYKRSTNSNPHIDYETKEQYTAKNIITYQVANSTIPGGGKGRQELANIGSGEGYYISNGYAVPIKWTKTTREEQTVYTYLNGEEIKVNDGNTYIQIQPKNQTLAIN